LGGWQSGEICRSTASHHHDGTLAYLTSNRISPPAESLR
jgi:hypothetical protein